ncbi:MAG: hypothetical protein ABIP75_17095 [Pyrinomonadaceae bacterium]
MKRNPEVTETLRGALARLITLTSSGELHWERQLNSSHRYGRWKNHLLIIGPDLDSDAQNTPRYLFMTPFDSPDCIEINSNDAELGHLVLALVDAVNSVTVKEPATDPFAVTESFLNRLFD